MHKSKFAIDLKHFFYVVYKNLKKVLSIDIGDGDSPTT